MSFGNTLFEGRWEEAISHPEAIPQKAHIRIVEITDTLTDQEEQAKLESIFQAFFSEVDKMEFTPPTEPLSPQANAVLEKFRRKGLRV